MLVIAHRGASADAPENTLAAFREAVAQGADGVELDVMLCGTGELVVCHDERLTRLAGLDWEVAQTPLWKLRTADVGTRLGFGPAQVPLLEEVVEALPQSFLINIEIKSGRMDDRGLSARVADYVRSAGIADRTVVSSFNPFCLWRVADRAPELRRGVLIAPERRFFYQRAVLVPLLANYSVHPCYQACTSERVSAWVGAGLRVVTWTVDDVETALRLRAMGVAQCITNRPAKLRAGLRAAAPGA